MIDFALGLRRRIGDWLNNHSSVGLPGVFCGPLSGKRRVLIIGSAESEADKKDISTAKKAVLSLCPSADVFVLCHCPQNSGQTFISDSREEYFSEKDLSFFFKIRSQRMLGLLSKKYDMAIALAQDGDVLVNYIARFVVADLRIGRLGTILDRQGLLNFVVKSEHGDGPGAMDDVAGSLRMIFGNSQTQQ